VTSRTSSWPQTCRNFTNYILSRTKSGKKFHNNIFFLFWEITDKSIISSCDHQRVKKSFMSTYLKFQLKFNFTLL
jgi:hypothetical protein